MFLATLVEMGFDQGISKVALSKTGSKSVQVCNRMFKIDFPSTPIS